MQQETIIKIEPNLVNESQGLVKKIKKRGKGRTPVRNESVKNALWESYLFFKEINLLRFVEDKIGYSRTTMLDIYHGRKKDKEVISYVFFLVKHLTDFSLDENEDIEITVIAQKTIERLKQQQQASDNEFHLQNEDYNSDNRFINENL